MIGAADGVFVVLHHHQRVALGLRAFPGCRAGCGCRADAGRWSARRGCSTRPAGWSRAGPRAGCAAPRRPRAWARRGPASGSRGPPAAGSRGGCAARPAGRARWRLSRAAELDVAEERARAASTGSAVRSRQWSACQSHRQRLAIEPLAVAGGAGLVDLQPLQPGIEHVIFGAGLLARFVPAHGVELEAGAETGGAPAVARVVGEQPRVRFGETRAQDGQARLVENTLRLRVMASSCAAAPWPARRGCRARAPRPCRDRARRRVLRAARLRCPALTLRSATGSSSVCSLKRSRRGQRVGGMNSPSTRRWV